MTEERDYLRTHPWITFNVDLRVAHRHFWMLMGEATSKCEHITYVPLGAETARQLMLVYFAKGVNATTAIEGNTLSDTQVLERIEGHGEALEISKEYLGVEVDNMINAYNGISDRLRSGENIPIDIDTLCSLNKQILAGLELDKGVVAGELRQHSVSAGPYLGAPWQDIPYLLNRLFQFLEEDFKPESGTDRIAFGFIKAVTAHIYIEWIHPFGDGNGRLGRLAEFMILLNSGIPAPAAHLLTSHYNDTRTMYYRQLNNASRNGGDLCPFLMYAAQGFVDGLSKTIKHLHQQQEALMWQSYVDDQFQGRRSEASDRQRTLAVELGKSRKWLTRTQLRRLVPDLSDTYSRATTKMLTRDINRLLEKNLIVRDGARYRANLSIVRGMRPYVIGEDGAEAASLD
jgi:Fic family protein